MRDADLHRRGGLQHVFDIIDDGEVTTTGDARYYNVNEPHVEKKYLLRILLDHDDRVDLPEPSRKYNVLKVSTIFLAPWCGSFRHAARARMLTSGISVLDVMV